MLILNRRAQWDITEQIIIMNTTNGEMVIKRIMNELAVNSNMSWRGDGWSDTWSEGPWNQESWSDNDWQDSHR